MSYAEWTQHIHALDRGQFAVILLVLVGTFAAMRLRRWRLLDLPTPLPDIGWPLIMSLAALVRIPALFSSFWYDETFSAAVASLEFGDLHRVILSDVHPPLSYLMQWMIYHTLGDSEWLLRLPSFAFGLISIYLIYRVTVAFGLSHRAGMLAALIVAMLPAHVFFSTEARGYALLLVFVLLMLISILENKPRYFVLAALAALTHAHGYIYLGVSGAAALAYHPTRRWIMALIQSGIVASIWIPFMAYQARDVGNGFWLPELTIYEIPQFLVSMTTGLNMSTSMALVVFVLFWSLTGIAVFRNIRWMVSKRGMLWLSVAAGVPALTALLSWSWSNVYLHRALMPSAIMLVILWSKALVDIRPGVMIYRKLFAVLILIPFVFTVIYGVDRMRLRSYMARCDHATHIYAPSTATAIIARYYTPNHSTIYIWSGANDLNQWLSDDAKDALGFIQVDNPSFSNDACIPFINNPMVDDPQRRHIESIYPAYVHTARDGEWYKFQVIRTGNMYLDIPNPNGMIPIDDPIYQWSLIDG